MKLSGKTALVTGGARRVGRAIALELAEAGCNVVVHYRTSQQDADETAAAIQRLGRRADLVCGDLADASTWPRVIDHTVASMGGLDILINNASAFQAATPDRLEDFDPQLWQDMLQVNLIAPVALSHFAAEHLKRSGYGKIVNLVDIAAERPWTTHLAYCASKAGLATATKALAKALAPRVRVNAVAPGIAIFPEEYSPHVRAALVAKVPLQREGTPQEIARAVRFLVESGDYVTGEVIAVDGGRRLN